MIGLQAIIGLNFRFEPLLETFRETPLEIFRKMEVYLGTTIKFPNFNGKRNNFHKFILCCDIIKQLVTNNVQQIQFLNIIKCQFIGLTYIIIKYKQFNNWNELKQELQNHFLEKRTLTQIQTVLLTSRQKPNESVRNLANRLEKLTSDLNYAYIARKDKKRR